MKYGADIYSMIQEIDNRYDLEWNDLVKYVETTYPDKKELFEKLCDYEGLIHYGSTLLSWVEGIWDIEL